MVGVGEQAPPHRHQATATAMMGVGAVGVVSSLVGDCNRRDRREGTGIVTSLVGDCNTIGTWNVLSLNKTRKLANVLKEMKRMRVGIMGMAETFWTNDGVFQAQLPESEGGDK